MYRSYCRTQASKCGESLQSIVLAVSPVYAEYLDDIVEDLLNARFGILKVIVTMQHTKPVVGTMSLQKKQLKLSKDEVHNWFFDTNNIEDADLFTDCTSTFFLLAKQSALNAGRELARFHNSLSMV